jgi:PAS domain S-box-containing protein
MSERNTPIRVKPSDPDKKKPDKETATLRARAEGLLAKQKERLQSLSSGDLKKLVHELGTHQIELEMQNEELREARQELEASRNKYVELYDFSPVGYFTINSRGLIQEANRTGAGMLGVEKRILIGSPFALFIERDDLPVYEGHRRDTVRNETRQVCELRIQPRNAPPLYCRLQSAKVENAEDTAGLIRTALIDITDRKRAEDERERFIAELQDALAKIKTLSGLLPICASCKKIRNDAGYWQQVEHYVSEHTGVHFTHGLCPECFDQAMNDIKKLKKE